MKILIIRFSSLGDIVLTQPVISVLREFYEEELKIDYLTKRQYASVISAFNEINNIYFWEKKAELLKNLRQKKFDLVIDLQAKFNSWLVKFIVKPKKIVTYQKKHFYRFLLIKKFAKKPINSTTDLYFSALRKLGIEREANVPKLYIKKTDDLLASSADQKLGIFPGALHKTKQYPIEQLVQFMDKFLEDNTIQIYILGSAVEKKLSQIIRDKSKKRFIDLCGKLSTEELLIAIQEMDFVISNDSGPMHIAAAMNKPQIAIFGATHPKLGFAPQNEKAIILCAELPCQPCSLHGSEKCPLNHFKCMKNLTAERLFTTFVTLRERFA